MEPHLVLRHIVLHPCVSFWFVQLLGKFLCLQLMGRSRPRTTSAPIQWLLLLCLAVAAAGGVHQALAQADSKGMLDRTSLYLCWLSYIVSERLELWFNYGARNCLSV